MHSLETVVTNTRIKTILVTNKQYDKQKQAELMQQFFNTCESKTRLYLIPMLRAISYLLNNCHSFTCTLNRYFTLKTYAIKNIQWITYPLVWTMRILTKSLTLLKLKHLPPSLQCSYKDLDPSSYTVRQST